MHNIVNGIQLKSTITLTNSLTTICVDKHIVTLEYALTLTQQSIDGTILALQNLRLCSGVSYEGEIPKTFQKEILSTIHDENSTKRIARSKACKRMLPYFGKTDRCKTCLDSYNRFKKRLGSEVPHEQIKHKKLRKNQ